MTDSRLLGDHGASPSGRGLTTGPGDKGGAGGPPGPVAKRPAGPVGQYLADSRSPLNATLLILPLFLIYSLGLPFTGGVRNGVDIVSTLLRYWPWAVNNYLLLNLAVMALFVVVALAMRKRNRFRPKIYLLVVLEGALYGLLLAQGVPRLLAVLHVPLPGSPLAWLIEGVGPALAAALTPGAQLGLFDKFVLALGAGVWEEIVFRLGLLGGLFWLLTRALKLPRFGAWLLAVVVSSLLFSAVHYVGNMADAFTIYSFLFRFFAGAVFAVIFALRGLAVAVYTHAVYDVMVMVVFGG